MVGAVSRLLLGPLSVPLMARCRLASSLMMQNTAPTNFARPLLRLSWYFCVMHAWHKCKGSSIVGLSRKGKEFFKMASPLSETIHHMAVRGARYRSFHGIAI